MSAITGPVRASTSTGASMARARSMKSWTAGGNAASNVSGCPDARGGTRYCRSPRTRSGLRLVAMTRSSALSSRNSAPELAAAGSSCSRLSSTSNSDRSLLQIGCKGPRGGTAVDALWGVSARKWPNWFVPGSNGQAGAHFLSVRGPLRGASVTSCALVPGASQRPEWRGLVEGTRAGDATRRDLRTPCA